MGRGTFGVFGLAVIALLMLGACARAVVTAPPRPVVIGTEETGLASWYGYPYHGRPTASGEIYDMYDLTAAHASLPLGTRLMVSNLDNGRVVEVRINDRGPFVDGRILDLSYGAANVLGAVGPGVVPVKIRVIALPGTPGAGSSAPAPTGGFSVQLGAFTARARADRLRATAAGEGESATVSETVVAGEILYRVRVGPYPDREAAEHVAHRLAARGYLPVVMADR
jgi:rare lipoprotein A